MTPTSRFRSTGTFAQHVLSPLDRRHFPRDATPILAPLGCQRLDYVEAVAAYEAGHTIVRVGGDRYEATILVARNDGRVAGGPGRDLFAGGVPHPQARLYGGAVWYVLVDGWPSAWEEGAR